MTFTTSPLAPTPSSAPLRPPRSASPGPALRGRAAIAASLVLGLAVAPVSALPAHAATTCLGKTVTIQGTSEGTTIQGTSGDDVIDGGAGADTISGGGGNDTICGGDGNDVIVGGAGADRLDGGGGTDRVSYAGATAGVTASLTTNKASGGAGTDVLSTFENILGSSYADTLTGSTGANTIDGGAGSTKDTLAGGGGADTLSYASAASGVSVNLATGAVTGGGGADSVNGFVNLTGSSSADTLVGTDGANKIDGGKGIDTASSGKGSDALRNVETVTVITDAAGAVDTVANDVPAGGRFFFDNLNTGSAGDALTWSATGPDGAVPFQDTVVGTQDEGAFTAVKAGTVTTTLGGRSAGTHTFSFLLPQTQTFSYTLGTSVTKNSPTAGQGTLAGPQDADVYTFSASAGQRVFLSALADTSLDHSIQATLTGPSGAVVHQQFLNGDRGPITLPSSGTYRLRFSTEDRVDGTGDYGFRLSLVQAAQSFSYTLGQTISKGSPGSGAGEIEDAQSEDRYTFSGKSGAKVFLDAISDTAGGDLWARVIAPSGATVMEQYISRDSAVFALPASGTYTLSIKARDDSRTVGTYSLALSAKTGDTGAFPLTLGTAVSNGVPAAGAGNLEGPGAIDLYTFDAAAGDRLLFDSLADATGNYGTVVLTAPGGAVVREWWTGQDRTIKDLPATGTYTLKVTTSDTTHYGTYSFRLSKAPAVQNFAVAVGQTVSNGKPSTGAGNLETSSSVDRYTFSATKGKTYVIDELADGTGRWAQIYLTGPSGQQMISKWLGGSDESFVATESGTHTMEVRFEDGDTTHSGTYSFVIVASN